MAKTKRNRAIVVGIVSEVVGELGLLWLTFGLLDGIRDSIPRAQYDGDPNAGQIFWSEISRPYLTVVFGVGLTLIAVGVIGRSWSQIRKASLKKKSAAPLATQAPGP